MAITVGDIEVGIKMKLTEFQAGITKISQGIQKFGTDTKKWFSEIGNGILELANKFKLILAVGIGAASYAIQQGIKSAVKYAEELDKMSKITGLAVEEFARLAYAAEQEHASLEGLQKTLIILTTRIGEAASGAEQYAEIFNNLGISIKNADGTTKSAYQVFLDLSDVMSKGTVSTEMLSAALEILGVRSGSDLIPLLKGGREEIERLGDEAERAGKVISGETVKALENFGDEINKIKALFAGMWLKVAADTVETMSEVAKKFEDIDWQSVADGIVFVLERTADLAGLLFKTAEWFGQFGGGTKTFTVENLDKAEAELDRLLKMELTVSEQFEMTFSPESLAEKIKFLSIMVDDLRKQRDAMKEINDLSKGTIWESISLGKITIPGGATGKLISPITAEDVDIFRNVISDVIDGYDLAFNVKIPDIVESGSEKVTKTLNAMWEKSKEWGMEIADTFSSFFENMLLDMDEFSLNWTDFLDNLKKTYAKLAADLLTEKLFMGSGGEGTTFGGILGSPLALLEQMLGLGKVGETASDTSDSLKQVGTESQGFWNSLTQGTSNFFNQFFPTLSGGFSSLFKGLSTGLGAVFSAVLTMMNAGSSTWGLIGAGVGLLAGLVFPPAAGWTFGTLAASMGIGSTIGGIVGSFAEGTSSVPKTGLAMVHQGEQIIPAGEGKNVTINFDGAVIMGNRATMDMFARDYLIPAIERYDSRFRR